MKTNKLRIPLPEQEALDLLLKVKPADEMPSRKKKAPSKSTKKPKRKN
jgi:hypothetical protein